MGYAGGEAPRPTYRDLRDHSEAVEIGYDPAKITYEQLLTEFFAAHTPEEGAPWSRQYRSAIFVHDEAEQRAAELARRVAEKRLGRPVGTAIESGRVFWVAEDYHQKYELRSDRARWDALVARYPDVDVLVHTTEAARLNAYAGGWLDAQGLGAALAELAAVAQAP